LVTLPPSLARGAAAPIERRGRGSTDGSGGDGPLSPVRSRAHAGTLQLVNALNSRGSIGEDLDGDGVPDEAHSGAALVAQLEARSSPRSAYIAKCHEAQVGDVRAECLAAGPLAAGVTAAVERLDLRGNHLADAACAQVLAQLGGGGGLGGLDKQRPGARHLTTLDLSHNKLELAGATALARALSDGVLVSLTDVALRHTTGRAATRRCRWPMRSGRIAP
jgi:hypothetical protein